MGMRVLSTPLDVHAAHVCYNIPHNAMAIVDNQKGEISTWQRDSASRDWEAGPSWTPEGLSITCIAWAAPEFGNILCAGTTEGIVCIWAQNPQGEWTKRSQIAAASRTATQVSFAPSQMGPVAAVAFADGSVRTFVADAPLDATTWDPHSEIQLDRGAGACTGFSWREYDPSLPPLLVVGSSSGGAQIFMFREQLLRWEKVIQLDQGGNSSAVSAVAWAPRLGRPFDLVAVASGRQVTLWSLTGAVDSLEVERVAVLEHQHDVWQLQWNMLGSWLAASTEGGEVAMWRANLSGEYKQWNKIIGGGSGGEGMMMQQ